MAGSAKNDTKELRLDSLVDGFPHVPPAAGAMMAQAAVMCLDDQGHSSGVSLRVEGYAIRTISLTWSETIDESVRRFWNDLDEATEQGAYAVAILLIRAVTGLTIIERSRKGTGFDWWVGNDDNLFQAKARLEVSGILRGSMRRINGRIRARIAQTMKSDVLDLPAYVVVVEFGSPRAKVVMR